MPHMRYFLEGQAEPLWTGIGDIVPQKDDLIRHYEYRTPTAMEVAELGVKETDPVYVHGLYLVIRRTLTLRNYNGPRVVEAQGWDVTLELVEQHDEFPTQK